MPLAFDQGDVIKVGRTFGGEGMEEERERQHETAVTAVSAVVTLL